MTNHEPDPISEVHASLDQLSRVAISAVLQMAELKARRGAEGARRRRDEQVALAKAMGAQLEDDHAGARAQRAVGDPAFVPTVSGGGAVGGANWWATAIGEDLGRMWEAATAQAAAGDPGAVEALEVLKRQVYERWGLSVDQDGTVVDQGGKEPSLKTSASSFSAPVGQQAQAAPTGAAIDSASDARTTASPVLLGTIEGLLSSAHPLGPSEDLVAAFADRGGDASAEARRLGTAQAVEVGAGTGLG